MSEDELEERAEAQVNLLDHESLEDGLSQHDYLTYLRILRGAIAERIMLLEDEIGEE